MKKFILPTLLFTSSLMANNLVIEIDKLLNTQGKISIGLYDNANSFAQHTKVYKGVHIRFSNTKIRYTFTDIPNGLYAISLFHDENENEKIDKNFLGIPTEGYGFSNNIRPTFRAASFDESKFELKGDKTIIIHMGY